MPKKSKLATPIPPESFVVPDFADEEIGKTRSEFDRVMRRLVQVPKSELDAALKKERSRKRRRSS